MIDDLPFSADPYLPQQVPHSGRLPGDWDRPANYPIYKERDHFLATVVDVHAEPGFETEGGRY